MIRSARLLHLIEADPDVELTLINSGQHYDRNMLRDFLEELNLPKISIDLKAGSGDGVKQTATIMARTAQVLVTNKPDVVCVFGDTNSSLGFALGAAKIGVPLVHIEAGCRCYEMGMPEELNRRIIDHISGLLLAVSDLCAENLRRESVLGKIDVVGDPQFDVFVRQQIRASASPDHPRGLITLHRPENVGDAERLGLILTHVERSSGSTGLKWIFPVHPRTRLALRRPSSDGIRLVEPIRYRELLAVLFSSRVCVTDSGGLQKEAFWARVPCVTVRRTTEWMETIWERANILASPPEIDLAGAIVDSFERRLSPTFANPYGDGAASEAILAKIKEWSGENWRFQAVLRNRTEAVTS